LLKININQTPLFFICGVVTSKIMKKFKYIIEYNNMPTGKQFFNKKDCKKEWNRLFKLGLYGYTITKIN